MIMNYFKKIDFHNYCNPFHKYHSREWYLERLRFIERPLYCTDFQLQTLRSRILKGLADVSELDLCVYYFSNKSHTKSTRYICNDNIIQVPERMQSLILFALYNHGLEKMSVLDLDYIYRNLV